MNILLVNKYLYKFGGPESLMFLTAEMLERHGHAVSFFGMAERAQVPEKFKPYLAPGTDYARIDRSSWRTKAKAAIDLVYARDAARCIDQLLEAMPQDIVHFRNIYHQLSPSIFGPVRRRRIPSVLSVHDYKLVCPNYRLYTHDGVCRRCVPGKYYQAVIHTCVKESRAASVLSAVEMYAHHTVWDVYRRSVDAFITENAFMRGLLIEAGFDAQAIHVVPNFVDVAAYEPAFGSNDYILYFGRLVPEKGVATLIDAVQPLAIALVVVGEGPQRDELEAHARATDAAHVTFVGPKWGAELARLVAGARFIVVPSENQENSPMVVYQSFAWGKPVVGARMGGIPDLIDDGVNGCLFEAGNVADLRDTIDRLFSSAGDASVMGRAARLKAEREFLPDVYYERLLAVYASARQRAQRS